MLSRPTHGSGAVAEVTVEFAALVPFIARSAGDRNLALVNAIGRSGFQSR